MKDEENEVFGSRKIGGKFNVSKFRFFFVLIVIRFMSSLTAAVYRMETRCWVGNHQELVGRVLQVLSESEFDFSPWKSDVKLKIANS